MQALLDDEDDLYNTISTQNDQRNDSALNMSIPVSPEVA